MLISISVCASVVFSVFGLCSFGGGGRGASSRYVLKCWFFQRWFEYCPVTFFFILVHLYCFLACTIFFSLDSVGDGGFKEG
jgi:hypothetical protein